MNSDQLEDIVETESSVLSNNNQGLVMLPTSSEWEKHSVPFNNPVAPTPPAITSSPTPIFSPTPTSAASPTPRSQVISTSVKKPTRAPGASQSSSVSRDKPVSHNSHTHPTVTPREQQNTPPTTTPRTIQPTPRQPTSTSITTPRESATQPPIIKSIKNPPPKKPMPTTLYPTEEKLVEAICGQPHTDWMHQLALQNNNLKVVTSLWGSNGKDAVSALGRMNTSVAVDIINMLLGRPDLITLDIAGPIQSLSNKMIIFHFEEFQEPGLKTSLLLLTEFGPLIEGILKSPMGPGVDISREERKEKCLVLLEQLLALKVKLPSLMRRPGPIGKLAAQLTTKFTEFDFSKH
ncbi:con80 domain of Katanin [Pelomyxa schiedti]|nr:con80 domain of Katanin [Pelomyxa schiedti]